MVFTKEQITPACLDLFRDALKKLPGTIPLVVKSTGIISPFSSLACSKLNPHKNRTVVMYMLCSAI